MALTIFDLPEHNPWWRNVQSIEDDKHIAAFNKSAIHWEPAIWQYMPLDASDFVFYTIRGPRQVGKTTSIKLAIRKLLKEGAPPQSIFFWPCDDVRNSRELIRLIELFLSNPFEREGTRRYVFLDEITSVKDWQKSVKYLYDSGKLKNLALVLSGSHALGIKASFGELVGRTGEGNPDCHKMFVPMKFAEFVSCVSSDVWGVASKSGLNHGGARRAILIDLMCGNGGTFNLDLPMIKKDLDSLLERYMVCGGVPRAISEYLSRDRIPNEVFETYVGALRGDLAHWNRDNQISRLLVSSLVKRLGGEASWGELAREVSTAQPTITDYVEALEQCFTLTYFFHTSNTKTPKPDVQKNKKFYFEDPFIYHSLRAWVTATLKESPFDQAIDFLKDDARRGLMVENLVANHLVRLNFNLNPHSEFVYNSDIFYTRANGKKEIDFILNLNGKCVPIEVKYQSSVSVRDLDAALRVANENGVRALLITKDNLRIEEKYVMIPASLFLFLI